MERPTSIDSNIKYQYEERYIAFIDILGFTSLVNRAEKDASLLEKLASILEEVATFTRIDVEMTSTSDPKIFFNDMFRMSTFSDNIVISTKINTVGLVLIAFISAMICNKFLHLGIFTRGAITKGKLIHTTEIVLGDGLIRAYNIYNTTSVYPRIILDNDIVKEMDGIVKLGDPDLRRQDFDGLWHLHILHHKMLKHDIFTTKTLNDSINNLEYMTLCRQEIENTVKINSNNLSIKAKIGWLVKYFNEYAEGYGLDKIKIIE
jgi:hypothetical protein